MHCQRFRLTADRLRYSHIEVTCHWQTVKYSCHSCWNRRSGLTASEPCPMLYVVVG
jgi:hypothetical protein